MELAQVKQMGSVNEYQEQFESLSAMVRGWTLEALVGAFIAGAQA